MVAGPAVPAQAWARFGKLAAAIAILLLSTASPASASCISPQNAIEAENCKPGNPSTQWDVSGVGDTSIQGFATSISVNIGQTVFFKVSTNAAAYRLDIYRLGYYGGMGARLVTTISPSAQLPQTQPACLTDSTTGLLDCGNWAVSASWAVPTNATPGIYFARLVRRDTNGASHLFFIVRNDASHSDLVFQTSDTTWQAYNDYGASGANGSNLYGCNGTYNSSCRAFKVSYNRPFYTRSFQPYSWVFNAEYPMVRWLEANGYDVTYISGVDTDRNGTLLTNHKVFLSVGHDEYWSANQRANVEGARATGVQLAFFSGNEIFWKIRWENSIDGSGTPYRTLVCYKETFANSPIDPQDPPTWTGTWRDPRFSPPADGGRPGNALSGTLFQINSTRIDSITVPQADGRMRFWRNTGIASLQAGQSYTMPAGTLGYEWDIDADNGFRPAGLFHLSTVTITVSSEYLLDYGTRFGAGTATHNLTLYRYHGGALVFGAGTVQWSWGLDNNHDNGSSSPDLNMQQATVNLLADMGVQPATLQAGLIPATPSTDTIPPTSIITSPASGGTVAAGSTVSITGTAVDTGGGVVAGVEVSVDGGTTWHPATGRQNWSYVWIPIGTAQSVKIMSRAVDDSGNLETPLAGVTVNVQPWICPCTIWSSSAVPGIVDTGPSNPVELGVKFRADSSGSITGIRFYKSTNNTGTHVANLWSSSGTLLATATFSNETPSGWQQVNFATPVAISGNTVYVASYHTTVGHWSVDRNYFATAGVDNPPLHALANGVSGGDGVYLYGATSGFPTNSYQASNYWVDVVFTQGSPPTLSSISVTPSNPSITVGATQQFTATGNYSDGSAQNITSQVTWSSSNTSIATITASGLATGQGAGSATISATYNGITGSTSLNVQAAGTCPCTIWSSSAVPGIVDTGPSNPVELGVKFRADSSGSITGIRFYKSTNNTGTHVANLWSSSGTLLATATFSNETPSGWQQVNFATPVAISGNTVYVASYHTTVGHWSVDRNYFATAGVDNPPLHALANGVSGGDGVYLYGATSGFPTNSYQASNYWVDVVFQP